MFFDSDDSSYEDELYKPSSAAGGTKKKNVIEYSSDSDDLALNSQIEVQEKIPHEDEQ